MSSFMNHHNELLALFDPAHLTFSLVKQRPILLAAIMFASARYTRPELADVLHSHVQIMVSRQVFSGDFDLSTVQALLILVLWKYPRQDTAYSNLGIAIRLGFQLQLHVRRTTPLPDNVEEARTILDAERTWISRLLVCAALTDRSLQYGESIGSC
jgi:hypothetical protein